MDGLRAFNNEVTQLTQQLVIMILPVAGMVLYFVSLVAGMLVGRQQAEDAILRSRGMSRRAIVVNHFLMWLILAVLAFGIGLIVAPFVVQLVSRTTSFLRFSDEAAPIEITYSHQSIFAGAGTSLLAASSGLYLAWRSSGNTVTENRRSMAREGKAWWQRLYLDILLLIPAAYVFYTLYQEGGLETDADNPFADPLTFLGPTLFALGMTLFFLRMLPFMLGQAAKLISVSRSVALLMALRELTRSTGRYRGMLLMMCLTLSLTGFMASMASTLDRSLKDSVDYQIGADAVIITATDAQTETSTDATQAQTQTVTGFNALPANDLLAIDGVYQVSRVGRYPARLNVPGQRLDGTALGIDRAAIASVARAREDYAAEPFAALFNRLAGSRTGILISAATAQEYNLLIGQEVEYQVFALNTWYETTVPIVGLVDFFPTLDPRGGFFLITNLDPIFEAVGTPLPHDLWVSLEPDADVGQVRADVRALGFPILDWHDPESELLIAQAAPARRGVFGFLSVGFVAAIALTIIIAIIQSAASFQTQAMQLGSLRAMGLSGVSVGAYMLFSQGIAALGGILGGTGIGFATTLLYLPLLDFSGGLPPYLVRVAWEDIFSVYIVFAGIMFVVIVSTTLLMGREQLSTIVKLGDA
jgi:putative ABC transport system permease protein